MRLFVTGINGFIGTHLLDAVLTTTDWQVSGFDIASTNLAPYEGNSQFSFRRGDIFKDNEALEAEVIKSDAVIPLAGIAKPAYYVKKPVWTFELDFEQNLKMVRLCVKHNKRIIFPSTSEVYGTARYVPIDERHPRQPQSPYSATKIGADALAESFYNAFDLPVVIVRPFNTYGPRQSARAIIPTIISQIAAGKEVIKVGDLSPTRDFTYVTDTARGFLAIAQAPLQNVIGQEINIATNSEITMADTLRTIAELMDWHGRYEVDPERLRPSRSEVRRLWGDNAKIRNLTDWRPQVDIREGLSRTIAWFSDPGNLRKYKTDIYNR